MKRRQFVRTAAISAAVAGVAACAKEPAASGAPSAAAGQTFRWKMVTTWPPNFPGLGSGANRLAEMLDKASGGRLKVKVYGGAELVPALEVFDAKRMVQRIMGMGDVVGLAEKVQQVTSQDDVDRMSDSMKKNRLTLDDLLLQLEQVEKMGPLEKIIDLIPGASKLKVNSGDLDPNRLKRVKAVIQSMTPGERRNPAIIKGGRRRRIAEGSGTSVQVVNQVLKQYEQMNQLWKQFGKGRKGFSTGRLFGGKGFGSPFRP